MTTLITWTDCLASPQIGNVTTTCRVLHLIHSPQPPAPHPSAAPARASPIDSAPADPSTFNLQRYFLKKNQRSDLLLFLNVILLFRFLSFSPFNYLLVLSVCPFSFDHLPTHSRMIPLPFGLHVCGCSLDIHQSSCLDYCQQRFKDSSFVKDLAEVRNVFLEIATVIATRVCGAFGF